MGGPRSRGAASLHLLAPRGCGSPCGCASPPGPGCPTRASRPLGGAGLHRASAACPAQWGPDAPCPAAAPSRVPHKSGCPARAGRAGAGAGGGAGAGPARPGARASPGRATAAAAQPWRPPGCCRSCAAWTSAAMTSRCAGPGVRGGGPPSGGSRAGIAFSGASPAGPEPGPPPSVRAGAQGLQAGRGAPGLHAPARPLGPSLPPHPHALPETGRGVDGRKGAHPGLAGRWPGPQQGEGPLLGPLGCAPQQRAQWGAEGLTRPHVGSPCLAVSGLECLEHLSQQLGMWPRALGTRPPPGLWGAEEGGRGACLGAAGRMGQGYPGGCQEIPPPRSKPV